MSRLIGCVMVTFILAVYFVTFGPVLLGAIICSKGSVILPILGFFTPVVFLLGTFFAATSGFSLGGGVSFFENLLPGIVILLLFALLGIIFSPDFIERVVFNMGLPLMLCLLPVAYVMGVLFWTIKREILLGKVVPGEKSETQDDSTSERNNRKVRALCSYIRESMNAGYSVERITRDLKIAGWPENAIKSAWTLENAPISKD